MNGPRISRWLILLAAAYVVVALIEIFHPEWCANVATELSRGLEIGQNTLSRHRASLTFAGEICSTLRWREADSNHWFR
jgi:hypothetical protein